MLNCLNLVGRLTRDPEIKAIGDNNMVAKFTVAVDRNYKDKDGNKATDFIPCEAFGKTAEFAGNYLSKGRLISVSGEMRVDQYQNEEGENRTFTKCHVNSLNVLDSAKTANEESTATNTEIERPSKPAAAKKPTPKKPTIKKPAAAK